MVSITRRKQVTGGIGQLHNDLRNVNPLPNIIRITKSTIMRWMERVAGPER